MSARFPPQAATFSLTAVERQAIDGLLQVATAAFHLADNTEDSGAEDEHGWRYMQIDIDDSARLGDAIDLLAELPDDKPDYVLGEPGKAEWALRRLLDATPQPPAPAVRTDIAPGEMVCTECSFRLTRSILNAETCAVSASDDSSVEPCPNGCGMLSPATWEFLAKEAMATALRFHDEAEALRKEVAAPALSRAPTPQEISDYLAFCDDARKAVAEPRYQGYVDAFYEIAKVLGIEGARVESPKWVFENEILPKLKGLLP